jgi:chromosome segregation ATPase
MFGFLKTIWMEISGQCQIEQLKRECDSKTKRIEALVIARDELVIKIKQLNDQVYQLTKDESSQASKILELQASLSSTQHALNEITEQLVKANEDIEALKKMLKESGWLK